MFTFTKEKLLKENVHYKLLPNEDDNQSWKIRIESGGYNGVVYQYRTIQIKEEGMLFNKKASILFDYDVLSTPEDIIVDENDFRKYLGRILHSILINENNELNVKQEPNEHRNNHLTEFDI